MLTVVSHIGLMNMNIHIGLMNILLYWQFRLEYAAVSSRLVSSGIYHVIVLSGTLTSKLLLKLRSLFKNI